MSKSFQKKHEAYLDDDKNPIKHQQSRFKGKKRKKSSGCMNFDPERKQQCNTCNRKSSSAAVQISIMLLRVRTSVGRFVVVFFFSP
jgi:hypothetical protein